MTRFFADIPFARLDAVLLLIKTCLKGEMVDMLNTKDNQVFLDYLAGGQDKRIAAERQANASSDGALNVAARNVTAPSAATTNTSAAAVQQQMQPQDENSMAKDVSVISIKESIDDAKELALELRNCKAAYMDFSETKLEMEAKLHNQAVDFANAKLEMEAKLHAQAMLFARAKAEMEERANAQAMLFAREKAEMEERTKAQDLEHDQTRKKNVLEHESAMLKMRLEHETALANLKSEEEDKSLERTAKKIKLGEEDLKLKKQSVALLQKETNIMQAAAATASATASQKRGGNAANAAGVRRSTRKRKSMF